MWTWVIILFLTSGWALTTFCPSECSCKKKAIDCSNKALISFSIIESSSGTFDSVNLSNNHLKWVPVIRVSHLDVSSNLIEDFPALLPPIESLFLNNNKIKFAVLEECPASLRHLDISGNPVKELDIRCEGLQVLNVSHADIEVLSDKFLSKLKYLQVLHFDDNPLKKISGDLRSDTLEVLSLERTELRYIKPTWLTGLIKLKVVRLSGNKYIHSLNLMSGAEFLIANHCNLESIDLAEMPLIRVLEISDNHIKHLVLPHSLHDLKARNNQIFNIELQSLKRADLSKNSITSLRLQPMDWLNISGNSISNLKLTSINFLDASMCGISQIEGMRARFHTLNLSHNSLETFPEGLTLRKLDVSYNRLTSFKHRINSIEEVRLVGNRLVLAEDVVAQGKMYLGDNPWTCDCKMDHLYTSADDAPTLTCSHPRNVSGRTWTEACYKRRIPHWMVNHPYIPFVVSSVLLVLAIIFFYWLRRKLDTISEENPQRHDERATETETVSPQIRINNELPSYEEALLMPGIARKKNVPTQTRSYEMLSRRLSSNSI